MPKRVPSMYEWAMPADHPQHVATWFAEVFGGPACYSEEHGGYHHTDPPPQAPVPRWGWGEAPPDTGS